jgi:threonine synthase
VAVSDAEILDATFVLGRTTGIWPAPEGGATLAGLLRLKKDGWVRDGESAVLFNTGNGAKYSHIWDV